MKIKTVYLVLFVIGAFLPYLEFIGFIREEGLNFQLFIQLLFETRISRFFAYDVIISAFVVLVFILHSKGKIKYYWVSILATFLIGVSAGLPLFLYQRQAVLQED